MLEQYHFLKCEEQFFSSNIINSPYRGLTYAHLKHGSYSADSSLVTNNQIDVPLNLNPRHNQWPQRMDISIRPSL